MPFYQGITKLGDDLADSQRIAANLIKLRASLDTSIPPRTVDATLLVATWNLREFDAGKYGRRSKEAYYYIAEMVSRFDLVAIQEVKGDLSGLKRLAESLGPWWQYMFNDVTEGSKGNQERMAFLFDSRKIRFGGLCGEVVIPPNADKTAAVQLARSPFTVGFKAGWYSFSLTTVHILYGTETAEDPDRLAEIKSLATFLRKRAEDKFSFSNNLILLGDFNIFNPDDVTMQALTSEGFVVPRQLQRVPSNVPQNKFYDQIAFLAPDFRPQLDGSRAGVFNFANLLYTDADEPVYAAQMGKAYTTKSTGTLRNVKERNSYYREWRSYQLSDHLPMWVELRIDRADEFLSKAVSETP